MRVRGLKHTCYKTASSLKRVAPHAGAWIETSVKPEVSNCEPVAPHAGAWIETVKIKITNYVYTSHPMRVRGLKH